MSKRSHIKRRWRYWWKMNMPRLIAEAYRLAGLRVARHFSPEYIRWRDRVANETPLWLKAKRVASVVGKESSTPSSKPGSALGQFSPGAPTANISAPTAAPSATTST